MKYWQELKIIVKTILVGICLVILIAGYKSNNNYLLIVGGVGFGFFLTRLIIGLKPYINWRL